MCFLQGVIQTIQQQIYTSLNNLLPEALAEMVFQEATQKVVNEGTAKAGDIVLGDQGSKQLGKDMASCPGFTIEEFSQVDFDNLDLSEWLSTMYEADILSTTGYDIERLTGTGRALGNQSCDNSDDADCEDKTRVNANDRATNMFSDDASGAANELKNTFDPEQIDCSVYPRPLVCEMSN